MKTGTKIILSGVIIACIVLIIGLSVMAGYYDILEQKGFCPLAFLLVGYPLSIVGLMASSIVLGIGCAKI